MPKFTSKAPVAVSTFDRSAVVELDDGVEYETDDPKVVASLRANPDVSEVRASHSKKGKK